jgi:hypothetical protein
MNVMNPDAGGGGEATPSSLLPREPNTRESIRGKSAGLDRGVQLKIGQLLRAMYDDVLSQGLPNRFVEFLNRLDPQPSSSAAVVSTTETSTPAL